jgi:hypothetical protein
MEYSTVKILNSRRLLWADHVVRMEEKRNAYRALVRNKTEGIG